jgi:hypothetical protein
MALADALALVLDGLADLVAARFRILGPITNLLHRRIRRACERVRLLLLMAAQGRAPRTHPPRPGRPSGPPPAPFPRKPLWLLVALGPHAYHAAGRACGLRHILSRPETETLLRALPPATRLALARALRPVGRMIGLDVPPLLTRAGPPRPPYRRPPQPPAPPREPMRPLPAYVRDAVRFWKPIWG